MNQSVFEFAIVRLERFSPSIVQRQDGRSPVVFVELKHQVGCSEFLNSVPWLRLGHTPLVRSDLILGGTDGRFFCITQGLGSIDSGLGGFDIGLRLIELLLIDCALGEENGVTIALRSSRRS
jgi:hypothetical protein